MMRRQQHNECGSVKYILGSRRSQKLLSQLCMLLVFYCSLSLFILLTFRPIFIHITDPQICCLVAWSMKKPTIYLIVFVIVLGNSPRDAISAWAWSLDELTATKVVSTRIPERFVTGNRDLHSHLSSHIQKDEMWTCLCDPGGQLGTQIYIKSTNTFTNCDCKSTCPLCNVGQVLDPLALEDGHCLCKLPMLIIVRFFDIQIWNYSLEIERKFSENFSGTLEISLSQVMIVSRQGGKVTLYIDILPSKGSHDQNELERIESNLNKKNDSSNGIFQDPELGAFAIVRLENPYRSSYLPGWKYSGRAYTTKLFMAAIVLAPLAALVVLLAVVCIIWHKPSSQKHISVISFNKDKNASGFTSINQGSPLIEDPISSNNPCLQVYTDCMQRVICKCNNKWKEVQGATILCFSYPELAEATQQFSNLNVIGVGGSSTVYQGHLPDGRVIAVKKLNSQRGYNADHEFCTEIEILSRIHHFHLVPFIGYCLESNRRHISRLLVYKYMSNGSLRDQLDGIQRTDSLKWSTRVRIALGAARGLEYLHYAASPRVLHCDFKSSNILLDSKWRAKVADFGVAKTFTNNDDLCQLKSPNKTFGTFGYFAPEYALIGRPSMKSDVFSFGVVLLEIISGRRALDASLPEEQQSLVLWASPFLHDEKMILTKIADPCLNNAFPKQDLIIMAQLAKACLQMDPELRPTMTAVVQVLATLIPEHGRQAPLLLLRNIDFLDYNFSREDVDMDTDCKEIHVANCTNNSTYQSDSHERSDTVIGSTTGCFRPDEVIVSEEETKIAFSKVFLSRSELEHIKILASYAETSCRSSNEEQFDLTQPHMEKF